MGTTKALGQSAQDSLAVLAHPDRAVPEVANLPELAEFKSLIVNRFTALGKQTGAQTNRCGFAAPPGPGCRPFGMIAVTHEQANDGFESSLPWNDKFCKTGLRPGIEGLFGKRLPEVASNDSRDTAAFGSESSLPIEVLNPPRGCYRTRRKKGNE